MKHTQGHRNDVSRETCERLEAFVSLLLKWNRTINLISRLDEAQIWTRHIDDSLGLTRLLPTNFSHATDLGSGGGMPGLVLAIATNRPFHLIEADQRKAAFLREAARAVCAPVIVHASRIEAATPPPAPVITARALAPLTQLLAWALPHLAPHGICIFPKGRASAAELSDAQQEWNMRVETTPSTLDPAACIYSITEIARVSSNH